MSSLTWDPQMNNPPATFPNGQVIFNPTYASFYSVTDLSGTSDFQLVLDAVDATSPIGPTLDAFGRVVITDTGVYSVTLDVQLDQITASPPTSDPVYTYLTVNGQAVPYSASVLVVQGLNGYTHSFQQSYITCNAGDRISGYCNPTTNGTNIVVRTIPAAGNTPDTPSVQLNIIRIA